MVIIINKIILFCHLSPLFDYDNMLMKGDDIMYSCTFLRNEIFDKFKKELMLPEDSFFAILKIDDKKCSYLIDGLKEVRCEYNVIKKYVEEVHMQTL